MLRPIICHNGSGKGGDEWRHVVWRHSDKTMRCNGDSELEVAIFVYTWHQSQWQSAALRTVLWLSLKSIATQPTSCSAFLTSGIEQTATEWHKVDARRDDGRTQSDTICRWMFRHEYWLVDIGGYWILHRHCYIMFVDVSLPRRPRRFRAFVVVDVVIVIISPTSISVATTVDFTRQSSTLPPFDFGLFSGTYNVMSDNRRLRLVFNWNQWDALFGRQ